MTVDKPDLGLHNLADGDFSVVADSTALSLTNTRQITLQTKNIDGWISRYLQTNNSITLRTNSTGKNSRIFVDTTGANFQFVNGANNASLRIGDSVAVRFNTSGSVGQVLTVTSIDGDGRLVINPKAGGSGTANCEQTLTKNSHGFRKWTPIYWNGSTWARPTYDSIIPSYIVVDSTSANTFKVANCGNYSSSLTSGVYYYTGTSPGYTLTQPEIKVPLFEVVQSRLILQPIIGFQLAGGSGGTGDVTSAVLSDTAAAIRADFPTPDGNGIISALPLADVTIQSSNDLYYKDAASGFHKTAYKNSLGATGTEIYRGNVNVRKLTTGSSGGFFRIVDTTGVGNTFYEGQLDSNFVQNAGNGPQISKAVSGAKVVGGEKAYFGVRNDTSGTIPIVRMMYGDRYSSPTSPDMHHIRAAVPNSATVYSAPFRLETTSSSGKLSADIDGSLFVRENGKVYIGADSSFIHDPVQDSTFFKGSLAILNGENGIKLNKTGNPSFPSVNIPAIISGRYDPEWKANYYFNPFGYFDIETINNYQADPRFTFRHARGVNTRLRLSVGTGVGNIFFSPYDGTEYYQGALIGSYVQANSANGKFSQAIIMSIDKSGGQPQISNNWKFHLDTARLIVLHDFHVGGNLLGIGSKLKVIETGFTGINEDTPLAQLHVNGDCIITSTLWLNSSKTVGVFLGTGSPEGVVVASVGSTFHRTNGGVGTSFYVKESGTGNTGWIAK
jgi:hypothetical protein